MDRRCLQMVLCPLPGPQRHLRSFPRLLDSAKTTKISTGGLSPSGPAMKGSLRNQFEEYREFIVEMYAYMG